MKPQRSLNRNATLTDVIDMFDQHAKVMAGNISFGHTVSNTDQGRNIDGYSATGTTPGTPNTQFAVAHNLGRVPIGFIVLGQSAAGTIYKGTTAWTTSAIYLECSAASIGFTIFIV